MNIHPTAIVDSGAELGADVVVGPYSVVDAHVVIGARTVVGAHVHLTGYTTIGEDCAIHSGAVLGEPPQDRKYHGKQRSYLNIGHRNIIREFVTMHLAVGEGNATTVGDDNMLMAYCHVGHNCVIGNNVCMANYVGLSGGCHIDDRVVLGGMCGIHQNVHIGRLVMVAGYCKATHDVPPFVIIDGPPSKLYGLNTVGLRRVGFSAELRAHLKQAFRLVCHGQRNLTAALAEARQVIPPLPEVEEFFHFMERSGRSGRHLEAVVRAH
ncbi:MAG TPA: acyl-ACP--UDP-N-acetylglucosamine O-acyltransferase [Armatimonadota bacterium]